MSDSDERCEVTPSSSSPAPGRPTGSRSRRTVTRTRRSIPRSRASTGCRWATRRSRPGGRIREHSHGDQVELQICFRGRGRVVVDGASHALVPGTACFLGYDVRHEILNEGDEELVLLWIVSPPGLEHFFQAIGRPRRPGEAAPAPFARPADVVAIERSLGLNDT